jgi:hypothetical protein
MSTILDALRKSKGEKESAKTEDAVLRHGMDDLIQSAGETPDDPPTRLRTILIASLGVIAILLATVVALHLRNEAHRSQASNTPPSIPAATARPVAAPAPTAPAPAPVEPLSQPVTPPSHSLFSADDEARPRQAAATQPPPPLHLSEPNPDAFSRTPLPAFTRPLEPPVSVAEEPEWEEAPPYVEPDEPEPPRPKRPSAQSIVDRLTVNGIFVDRDADPLAMINGESVRVGSTILGAEVREIRQDGVVVRINGTDYELAY